MTSLIKSWKTTATGIVGGVIVALTAFNDLLNSEQLAALSGAIIALVGLLARDGDKSSEDVGAKRSAV